jgi:hypothetical protein
MIVSQWNYRLTTSMTTLTGLDAEASVWHRLPVLWQPCLLHHPAYLAGDGYHLELPADLAMRTTTGCFAEANFCLALRNALLCLYKFWPGMVYQLELPADLAMRTTTGCFAEAIPSVHCAVHSPSLVSDWAISTLAHYTLICRPRGEAAGGSTPAGLLALLPSRGGARGPPGIVRWAHLIKDAQFVLLFAASCLACWSWSCVPM